MPAARLDFDLAGGEQALHRLNRIAGSTEKIAGLKPGEGFMDLSDPMLAAAHEVVEPPSGVDDTPKQAAARTNFPAKPEVVPTRQKELGQT
jgi:hypothetical protein